ncbi:DUF4142 domain-containing protein [Deinococcus sp. KNUC1210]|uniref:DUF4142 domain-containing protein n=1 Tax=Deinococcus sp. KNUC1210 TaxID=2917691 RepID=UPI001EF074D1|nr:DUF4142 domain-containing protein [Deinococcus sp. KNUC1210]ULH15968.1 DUF4142 domain-containing protein [Deinococcus sp. KNUC1210]
MNKLLSTALLLTFTSASAASMLSRTDTTFLPKAAMGNTFEIRAAKLALTMSKSAAVQRYANMMIADHSKLGANVKVATMKADPSMMLPAGVSAPQQQMLDQLKRAGMNFDNLYKAQMIASHAQTYQLFWQYSRSRAANRNIRAVIRGALPTVKMHWDDAKRLPRM